MAGTHDGWLRAEAKMIETMGEEGYFQWRQRIGAQGGAIGKTGGFASKKVGADGLDGPSRARIVGQKGGQASRRRSE